jgi:hypothetical protein
MIFAQNQHITAFHVSGGFKATKNYLQASHATQMSGIDRHLSR